jgi:hypothetical protein
MGILELIIVIIVGAHALFLLVGIMVIIEDLQEWEKIYPRAKRKKNE